MIEDALTYRTKEQVLYDLAKALRFSPQTLATNRKGRLSGEQTKQFAIRCIRPAVLAVAFAAAPFLIWTWMAAGQQQVSFGSAFPLLLADLANVKCLFATHGTMGGVIMLGSFLISLGLAAFMAFRIPARLWLDLVDGKVELREGRVVRREEQTNRPNGRDPIEKYFFCLRYLNMQVNLAAFRALEDGSIYLVYLLPRSEVLVSIEPKVEGEPAVEPKVETELKVEPDAATVNASEGSSPE